MGVVIDIARGVHYNTNQPTPCKPLETIGGRSLPVGPALLLGKLGFQGLEPAGAAAGV